MPITSPTAHEGGGRFCSAAFLEYSDLEKHRDQHRQWFEHNQLPTLRSYLLPSSTYMTSRLSIPRQSRGRLTRTRRCTTTVLPSKKTSLHSRRPHHHITLGRVACLCGPHRQATLPGFTRWQEVPIPERPHGRTDWLGTRMPFGFRYPEPMDSRVIYPGIEKKPQVIYMPEAPPLQTAARTNGLRDLKSDSHNWRRSQRTREIEIA